MCGGRTQSQSRRDVSSWLNNVGRLLYMTLTRDFDKDIDTASLWPQV
jgi:hypothetical protein